MLDLKWIRNNVPRVQEAFANKKSDVDVQAFLKLDEHRREQLTQVEQLKNQSNLVSNEIGQKKRAKENCDELMTQMKVLSEQIKFLDVHAKALDEEVHHLLLSMPNSPHVSVPVGASEADNVVVASWGEPRQDVDVCRDHQDIAESLGLLDLVRGAKLSGAGFVLYRGAGARLERALLNFMLDVHTQEHGYEEVSPPFIVNQATMIGTGQLPKMADDMYHIERDDLYLIPTAEVPVTNMYREETLNEEDLPASFVAYTPCFRREAGAYGKDTRGITRVHQFDKVELVRLVHPEQSYGQLELLRSHAEKVLQLLELPYRVLELCTADLSFAAAKCYDLEVWAPGQGKYLEVSSCSNFEDFQARRMALKYKPKGGGKAELVHSLNGSGIALARTFIAILENYQQEDGSVRVPKVLQSFMGEDVLR